MVNNVPLVPVTMLDVRARLSRVMQILADMEAEHDERSGRIASERSGSNTGGD